MNAWSDAKAAERKALIQPLIAAQPSGHSLQQAFYLDKSIFRYEIAQLFMQDWWVVCHVSQVAKEGDCFTYDVADESVIVARDLNGELNAFANVCRHRGSRLCEAGASHAKRIVCPYHAWTYQLNGDLLAARQAPEHFDKTDLGLKKLALHVVCGLVFVSFADQPASFDKLDAQLPQALAVFDLANTQVAHYENHPIAANWKLVFDNFNECYHCAPAHKEFSLSHSIMLDDAQQQQHQRELDKRAPQCGISPALVGLSQVDALAQQQVPYYYDRYALFEGYLTGSQNGKALAPLLGQVRDFDSGASNVQIGNFTYLLVYADHAVIYRFTPRSVTQTDAELIWLVKKGAQVGVDYDTERLRWLWHVTTLADKTIIERNQKGVLSRFYQPGPLMPMEVFTQQFTQWYLQALT